MIENDIAFSTTYTTVDMESTGEYIVNTGVRDESIGVGIDNPGVKDTSNEEKNNKDDDVDMIKIAGEDITEEDAHHPQLTSPTERRI